MNGGKISLAVALALAAAIVPGTAMAQSPGQENLMAMGTSSLRTEIQRRYDGALAATLDNAVVASDDNRYMWASQAKAQCGIALGFLKSGTKDAVSVNKCSDAFARMTGAAKAPQPTVIYEAAPPVVCNKGPHIVFFDWDRSDVNADQAAILDAVAATYPGCGGSAVRVTGYADRSGSDRYNQGLSERRAAEVKSYLLQHGVQANAISTQGLGESNPRVPTADGVRELQNRRVEITID